MDWVAAALLGIPYVTMAYDNVMVSQLRFASVVFPAYMVKRVMEDDGLADPGLTHNAPAARLGSLFGCDAALLVTIQRWDSKYMLIKTQTTVQFAPRVAPSLTSVFAYSPFLTTRLRGFRTFVKTIEGPQKTSSSNSTPV